MSPDKGDIRPPSEIVDLRRAVSDWHPDEMTISAFNGLADVASVIRTINSNDGIVTLGNDIRSKFSTPDYIPGNIIVSAAIVNSLFAEPGMKRATMLAYQMQEDPMNLYRFCFHFDFSTGITRAMYVLSSGEMELEGRESSLDEIIVSDLTSAAAEHNVHHQDTIPATQEAEMYMRYEAIAKKSADALRLDPTGFTLSDQYLAAVEANFASAGFELPHVPEFVIAGMKFGFETYKATYNRLTEGTHSPATASDPLQG